MISRTPKEVVELPVDELALLVLADVVATNEWNEYNYGNRLRQDVRRGFQ